MRMVLLRHEMPDGTGHFDWMIESGPGSALITYRVAVRIDLGQTTRFEAERIGSHRREYLEYQGELSGGRGSVQRIAEGIADIVTDRAGAFEVHGELGEARGVFKGLLAGKCWTFTVAPDPAGIMDRTKEAL